MNEKNENSKCNYSLIDLERLEEVGLKPVYNLLGSFFKRDQTPFKQQSGSSLFKNLFPVVHRQL